MEESKSKKMPPASLLPSNKCIFQNKFRFEFRTPPHFFCDLTLAYTWLDFRLWLRRRGRGAGGGGGEKDEGEDHDEVLHVDEAIGLVRHRHTRKETEPR